MTTKVIIAMSFKERFKGKISSINRQGDIIDTNANPGVKKQPHVPVIMPSHMMKPPLPPMFGSKPPPFLYQQPASYPYSPASGIHQPIVAPTMEPMVAPQRSSNFVLHFPKEVYEPPAISKPIHFPSTKADSKPLLANAKLALQQQQQSPIMPPAPKALSYAHSPKPAPVLDRKNFRDSAQYQIMSKDRYSDLPDSKGGDYSPASYVNHSYEDGNSSNYKPYTLRDYKDHYCVKEYTCLGGLGANTGGKEWKEKKMKLDRMTEYAKRTHISNKRRFISSAERMSVPSNVLPKEIMDALGKKKRMAEYAGGGASKFGNQHQDYLERTAQIRLGN